MDVDILDSNGSRAVILWEIEEQKLLEIFSSPYTHSPNVVPCQVLSRLLDLASTAKQSQIHRKRGSIRHWIRFLDLG